MAIGDTSRFSTIDDAVWAALRETSSTPGANLDAWRKEQDLQSGTRRGKDFYDCEIPPLDQITASDMPALVIVNSSPTPWSGAGADFEEVAYPKTFIGILQRSARESQNEPKIKKYCELVYRSLTWWRSLSFGLTDPVYLKETKLVSMEFPDFEKSSGVTAFTMTFAFILGLPQRGL